jgi:hypothetical protein
LKALQEEMERKRLEEMKAAKKDLTDLHAKGLQTAEEMQEEAKKLISVALGTDEEKAEEVIEKAEENKRKRVKNRKEELMAK